MGLSVLLGGRGGGGGGREGGKRLRDGEGECLQWQE